MYIYFSVTKEQSVHLIFYEVELNSSLLPTDNHFTGQLLCNTCACYLAYVC